MEMLAEDPGNITISDSESKTAPSRISSTGTSRVHWRGGAMAMANADRRTAAITVAAANAGKRRPRRFFSVMPPLPSYVDQLHVTVLVNSEVRPAAEDQSRQSGENHEYALHGKTSSFV
jgi:hypothetical protein